MSPLWTHSDAARATGGKSESVWSANGVSIDSRTVDPGDLFVAIKGPNSNGHDFVAPALDAGAAAAMVSERRPEWPDDAPLLTVGDTNEGLAALGRAARARIGKSARIIGVTGSVGKTGTKETLRHCLARQAPTTASEGNLNNQWGLPLSLARMPATTVYGIFEIGMNHAGEISTLSKILQPDIAIITTVEPVHTEFFDSVEAIADAKAEIFDGMGTDGIAILNRDNINFERLMRHATARNLANIISFGSDTAADVRLIDCALEDSHSDVEAEIFGKKLRYRLGAPGRHWALNSLAVLAGISAAGGDIVEAAQALANIAPMKGRGERRKIPVAGGDFTLIDESYNASPASMRAALQVLANSVPGKGGRRIAVLGDMLELGGESETIHADLAPDLAAADVDIVLTAGPHMAQLSAALPPSIAATHGQASDDILPKVIATVRAGDVVTVKGSLGSRMGPIADALRALDETHGEETKSGAL